MRKKYLRTFKKRGCGNICPQLKKKTKEKESYIYVVIIKITGGGLLVLKN